MAVATLASLCFIQLIHHAEGHRFVACHHHLGDALAIVYDEVFGRKID